MQVSGSMRMLVATHKRAELPSDGLYLPVHVGHSLSGEDFGYQPDDVGDNISRLNRSYCELTALYWAWKNLDCEVIGLSHYRRYFMGQAAGPNRSRVLSAEEAQALMERSDIVLGKPRNYVIETIESHYRNGHHGSDLDVLRDVILTQQPGYLDAYDAIFQGRKLSLYNMFLMRSDLFTDYADWLFGILDEVAPQIDNDDRTAYQQRTFGYLGERLLNVWVAKHADDYRVQTRKVVNTDGEPKLRKGVAFVRRKLTSASN